jgi:hypothetical protein
VIACVCDAETGRQCQSHARAPRPCPTCAGVLQRYSASEAGTFEAVAPVDERGFVRFGSRTEYRRRARAIWTCNTCEHCEVA